MSSMYFYASTVSINQKKDNPENERSYFQENILKGIPEAGI